MRRKGIALLFCLMLFRSMAQEYPHAVARYPFIEYEINKIDQFGKAPLEVLFQKMDSLYFFGKGQVNIVHIGGSHIQADIWSGQLRERLQNSVPGSAAGRGLVFPYDAARTNNPWNYKSKYTGDWSGCRNVQRSKDCPLGMTGISVATNDTDATLTIIPRDKVGDNRYTTYDFFRVKVFHSMDSASYHIRPLDSLSGYTQHTDSAHGYTEFVFASHLDTLRLGLMKTDTLQNHIAVFGMTLETDDPGFYYHAIGVNGASVPSYLRCKEFTRQFASLKPDLVILSVGINDAYESDFTSSVYEANYDTLIAMIRDAAPETAILFTTNNDSYKRRRFANENGLLVKDAMDRMGRKYEAAVWDLFSVMGGLDAIRTWERYGLAKRDKIHFSRDGYLLVGDLMYSALMKAYDDHLIRTMAHD